VSATAQGRLLRYLVLAPKPPSIWKRFHSYTFLSDKSASFFLVRIKFFFCGLLGPATSSSPTDFDISRGNLSSASTWL
jgi:hypothetical protein